MVSLLRPSSSTRSSHSALLHQLHDWTRGSRRSATHHTARPPGHFTTTPLSNPTTNITALASYAWTNVGTIVLPLSALSRSDVVR